MGVDQSDGKDILDFYAYEGEGANFWLSALNYLKDRGIEDVLIARYLFLNRLKFGR